MNVTTSNFTEDLEDKAKKQIFKTFSFTPNNDGLLAGTREHFQSITFACGTWDNKSIKKFTGEIQDAIVVCSYNRDSILYVTESAQRKLVHWSSTRLEILAQTSFTSNVVNVLVCGQMIVVILPNTIHIFSDGTLTAGHKQKNTPENTNGMAALSSNPDKPYLALPVKDKGILHVFNVERKVLMYTMDCHDVPIRCMAFNKSGNMLATTSLKGDVVNVYEMLDSNYTLMNKFKRGNYQNVVVYSLNFSNDSEYLVLASDSKTVHIFKIEDVTETMPYVMPPPESYFGYGLSLLSSSVSSVVSYGAEYVPSAISHAVSDSFTMAGSIARAYLPCFGTPTIATLTTIGGLFTLVVVNDKGLVYFYPFDKRNPSMDMKCRNQVILTDDEKSAHFGDYIPFGYQSVVDKTPKSQERRHAVSSILQSISSNDNPKEVLKNLKSVRRNYTDTVQEQKNPPVLGKMHNMFQSVLYKSDHVESFDMDAKLPQASSTLRSLSSTPVNVPIKTVAPDVASFNIPGRIDLSQDFRLQGESDEETEAYNNECGD